MHLSYKIGLATGTTLAIGAAAAYYHTNTRRRWHPAPPQKQAPIHTSEPNAAPTDAIGQTEAESDSQWEKFLERLSDANNAILSTLSIGDVLPDWSIGMPAWLTRLQRELNMEPGSLAAEIWHEARDPAHNPETAWDARVRVSAGLCAEEQAFLRVRREVTRRALARYLDLAEADVHADDVPVIASTGSGGGLRAMVAGAGYYQALTEAGLFDCTTYSAGVSGSCWLQSVYMSSIGQQSFERVIAHLKARIGVHLAYPPDALELLDTPPTNKYLLRGVVEKLKFGCGFWPPNAERMADRSVLCCVFAGWPTWACRYGLAAWVYAPC